MGDSRQGSESSASAPTPTPATPRSVASARSIDDGQRGLTNRVEAYGGQYPPSLAGDVALQPGQRITVRSERFPTPIKGRTGLNHYTVYDATGTMVRDWTAWSWEPSRRQERERPTGKAIAQAERGLPNDPGPSPKEAPEPIWGRGRPSPKQRSRPGPPVPVPPPEPVPEPELVPIPRKLPVLRTEVAGLKQKRRQLKDRISTLREGVETLEKMAGERPLSRGETAIDVLTKFFEAMGGGYVPGDGARGALQSIREKKLAKRRLARSRPELRKMLDEQDQLNRQILELDTDISLRKINEFNRASRGI